MVACGGQERLGVWAFGWRPVDAVGVGVVVAISFAIQ